MIEAEAIQVMGLLFGAYTLGWITGALFRIFNQFIEKI